MTSPLVDTDTGRAYQPNRNGDVFAPGCFARNCGAYAGAIAGALQANPADEDADVYARAWARVQALPRHSVERANLKSSVFGLAYNLRATGAKELPMSASSLLSPTTSPLLRHVPLVGTKYLLSPAGEPPVAATGRAIGDKLTIAHDTTNIHDHLAAPVYWGGVQAGWLGREVAPVVAFAVALGYSIVGVVTSVSPDVYLDVYAVAPSKKGRKLGKRGKKGKKPGRKPGKKAGKKAGKKPGRKPGKKLGRPPGKKLGRPPGKKTAAPAAK